MALHAASDSVVEFRATLDALGLAQGRVAQLFGVGPRSVRRWQHGDRRIPHGVGIVLRLLATGVITIDQVEQAAIPIPVRTNGHASPEPPIFPLVEPVPAQAAWACVEATTVANSNPTTAEKVFALAAGACRWPYGDPRRPDFRFCGNPAAAGPYCEQHCAAARLAYKTASPARFKGAYHAAALIALSASPAGASNPNWSVERLIGELIAATAYLFAQGLGECWARGKMNGQMSADTKEQGRALIAGLLELRNGTAGELDFNAVARSHGARVLKDRYGQGISDKTINSLINAALEILGRIVRARLN